MTVAKYYRDTTQSNERKDVMLFLGLNKKNCIKKNIFFLLPWSTRSSLENGKVS